MVRRLRSYGYIAWRLRIGEALGVFTYEEIDAFVADGILEEGMEPEACRAALEEKCGWKFE